MSNRGWGRDRWGIPSGRIPAEGVFMPHIEQPSDRADNLQQWGRHVDLPIQFPQEVIRAELPQGEGQTIYLQRDSAPVFGTDGLGLFNVPLFLWAQIIIGGGSGSLTRTVRVDDFLSIPVSSTLTRVLLYVSDGTGVVGVNTGPGGPFVNNPIISADAFLSTGIRGLPQRIIKPLISRGAASGTLIAQGAQVLAVRAHLQSAPAATRYLQIYDSANPVNNAFTDPRMEYVIGIQTAQETDIIDRFIDPAGFANGIGFAVSSTSGTTTIAAETVWLEVDLMML
jgi:hypothetical protein